MNHYICKIANEEEMNIKWDYEISIQEDKINWINWKQKHIKRFKEGLIIPYYGILDGKIICEATATLDSHIIQNSEGLVDEHTCYLQAFRTIESYQGQGYFSKLFHFMINDLKQKGYTRVTLGVEKDDLKNKAMYQHLGFCTLIKESTEIYPDGTTIDVIYLAKNL